MSKRQSTLSNFVKRSRREEAEEDTVQKDGFIISGVANDEVENGVSISSSPYSATATVTGDEKGKGTASVSRYDIGNYLRKVIDDELKYSLLTSPWIPENNFIFPISDDKRKIIIPATLVRQF